MIALIDADSLLYKVGFTFEEKTDWGDGEPVAITSDLQSAKNAIDGLIENIMFKTGCDSYELWLTGKDNFRDKVVDDYKHNRVNSRKPTDYTPLRTYLVEKYKAETAVGFEADDIVVYLKTNQPDIYFLCAIDKDVLYQSEGTHYNYNSDTFIEVSYYDTVRFFYYQILAGDPVDGYSGCKGIGTVKANKILDDAEELGKETGSSLQEAYYGRTITTYMLCFDCSEDEAIIRVQTTAQLACMHQIEIDKYNHIKLRLWSYNLRNFGCA